MGKKVGWSLNIETGIEVKQDSFNKAAKIFDNFYKKYSGKSVEIDTSDLITTVRDSINTIRQLYEEGTATSTSWLNLRPEMKSVFEAILGDAKDMFSNIKVLFTNGEYVGGMENILQGFRDQLSIVFSDIGGLYDELNQKQKDLFQNLGSVDIRNYEFEQSDIRDRIDALYDLIQVQKEMQSINSDIKDEDFASGMDVDALSDALVKHKKVYQQMVDFDLHTVGQLAERNRILKQIRNLGSWDDSDQYYAKDSKNYDESIDCLNEFINKRRVLISQLDDTEDELFRVDGIEAHKSQLLEQIDILEGYREELEELRKKSDDTPIGKIDFSEVINQLKEIKNVINEIKTAFQPLTDAFANGDSALSKMLSASVEDLTRLEAKLGEVYQMINTISTKQFNVQNIISNGSSTQGELEQIRQFRKEAKELYKQVEELYNVESVSTFNAIKGQPGGLQQFLDYQKSMADFDLSDLAKRIKSRSATSLGIVIDELNEWKKVLLQFNNLRNNVEAGSFNVSRYSDTSSKVRIGNKTTDKEEKKVVDENSIDNTDILNKVKTLSEQIETELTSIRSKIEETFNFATISTNHEHIKGVIDSIYQQFVELQSKINALDLNLNIPAIVTQVDGNGTEQTVVQAVDNSDAETSASKIDTEAQAMQDVANEASKAAQAKEKFSSANKEVAKTAAKTSQEVEEEAKKMEEAAGAIVEANDKLDKVKYVEDADGDRISKTTTSTTTRENAIETESSYYTYKDGEEILEAVTIVKDFKKRAAELKKESDKIALAQKTLDKFISQFESKTAGHASAIKGFDELKDFKIGSLDDIEKATQAMLELDNEYNKVTKNFRQGTKSMNPFVNAITGIDEMENKIREAEIAFDGLSTKPDDLAGKIATLRPWLDIMKSFISVGEDGKKTITNIYEMSEAYGELNVVLRQVNSSIKIQRKIDSAQAKGTSFGLDLEKQLSAMIKQKAQWEKGGQLTDELRGKIDTMFDSLANVTNSSELSNWKKQWSILKDEVAATKHETDAASRAQKEAEQQAEQAMKLQDKLYSLKKQLAKVDAGSAKGQELSRRIKEAQEQYDTSLKQLNNEEDRVAVKERQVQLERELIALQRQSQNSYGKTQFNREARYYDTITANRNNIGDNNFSDVFLNQLNQYESAFQRLQSLRDEIISSPAASNSGFMRDAFQEATQEVENLRKQILSTFKESQKLASMPSLGVVKWDTEKFTDAKSAMIDFAASVTDGKFKLEGFNSTGTEMYGTLDKGVGVVQKVTVALDKGTNSIYAYQTGTKKLSGSWQNLGTSLTKGVSRLAAMYLSFYDIIRYVRKGLTYVKEIDLAMTELKKVTDETDQTYKNFLKDASGIAGVIGSTVSDFTDATAAFARLGYSIEESSKMAETAIVYKNVADGLDTVEESTESIISTMKAYGIEANDTMGIIDRFNAVGKMYCPVM